MSGFNSTVFVIFGGTGDLTLKKIVPSLYDLWLNKQITKENHKIVIIGRREYTTDIYYQYAKEKIIDESRLINDSNNYSEEFKDLLYYHKMDYNDPSEFKELREVLKSFFNNDVRYMFYLAVAPRFFPVIVKNIDASGLLEDSYSKRLLIEKPFGDDLISSKMINEAINRVFNDEDIYRIDHYLAKEMLLNLITIRFGNIIFKKLWNSDSIKSIQITASESVGVEARGDYYDHSGALKDMVQSHLLQIVSLLLMKQPKSLSAKDLHKVQSEALNSLFIPEKGDFYVAGQYVANDDAVGYLEEERVAKESKTETYVALKLLSKLPEFKDVPIYFRTGKRLNKQSTMVVIEFKPTSITSTDNELNSNVLIIRIGPDEGIYFKVNVKKAGMISTVQDITMDFCQSCILENRYNTPQAYERILLLALNEDKALFTTWEFVKKSWTLIEEIKEKAINEPLYGYKAFTEGPDEANKLVNQDNGEWINLTVLGEEFSVL